MAFLLLAEALLLSIVLSADALQFGGTVNAPTDELKPEFESDEVAREAAEEAENNADRRQQKEMWDLPAELDAQTGSPAEPGCFVRTPAGCPNHPEFHSSTWKHATHAERSTHAGSNSVACEVGWKEKVARWCGTVNVEVMFVSQNQTGNNSGSSRTEEQRAGAGIAEQARSVATPKEPGCFMRTPTGCPKHPGSSSVGWKHDNYAERYTRATMNRTVCEGRRREELAQWCGAADVEVLFVAGVTAITDLPESRESGKTHSSKDDSPKELGCYIRTPSGCPKHPTLRSTSWQYEDLGEAPGGPALNKSRCEIERKTLVVEWCGVADVEVLFRQDTESGKQEADSGRQEADGGKQEADSGEQEADGGKQEADGGKQEADGGRQEADGGKQEADSGKQEADGGKQEADSGKQEADGGKQEADSGKQEADGGKHEADSGKQDADTSVRPTDLTTTPSEPGCFVRTPSGCPKVPSFQSLDWKRDEFAEKYSQAGVNSTECEVRRKAQVLAFCGIQDAEMLFVPGKVPPLVETGNWSQEPTEPGCYVRTPRGCPNHPVYSSSAWKHEEYGERAAGARADRDVCEVERRVHVAHWCGAEDVEILFIQEPGCFVRTPSGCPNHPSFHSKYWKHEEYGENNSDAKTNRSKCEVTRREHVAHWCGAEDVEILFIPGQETPSSSEGHNLQDVLDGADGQIPQDTLNSTGASQISRETTNNADANQIPSAREPQDQSPRKSAGELQIPEDESPRAATAVPQGTGTEVHAEVPQRETQYQGPVQTTTVLDVPEARPQDSGTELPAEVPNRETQDQRPVPTTTVDLPETRPEVPKRETQDQRPVPTTTVEFPETRPEVPKRETQDQRPVPTTTVDLPETRPEVPKRETQDQRPVPTTTVDLPGTRPEVPKRETQDQRPVPTTTVDLPETRPEVPKRETQDQRLVLTTTVLDIPEARPQGAVTEVPQRETQDQRPVLDVPEASSQGAGTEVPAKVPQQETQDQMFGGSSAATRGTFNSAEAGQNQQETLKSSSVPQNPEEVPTEPGCYVRTPSGCPRFASAGNSSWRRDVRGELDTAAEVNQTMCEVERRARLVESCGSEDVQTLFVPPHEPGCYIRTPTGCPNHPSFDSAAWKHDEYGENYTTAKVSRWRCELSRKLHLAHWCGTNDIHMKFVPPAWDNLIHVDERLDQKGVRPPTEPGCFVRTPSGCPAHPVFSSMNWKHVLFGATKVHTNRTLCKVERRARIAEWCGAEDVEVAFVPLPKAGCYVRTPFGCPQHPAFASTAWTHDLLAEEQMGAKTSRSVCEWARKAQMQNWCGVDEVHMLYVPRPRRS